MHHLTPSIGALYLIHIETKKIFNIRTTSYEEIIQRITQRPFWQSITLTIYP